MLHRGRNTIRRHLLPPAFVLFAAIGTSAWAGSTAAHFDVRISAAPTYHMMLQNGVYSPTGAYAILNVDDLEAALAAGNVEVTTGSGVDGSASGTLTLDAAMQWISDSTLTLDAYRFIQIERPLTAAGPGALVIVTGDGGKNGRLEFSNAGKIVFWGVGNGLSINGNRYTLVKSVASLAAAIDAAPDGNYALASSYDAAHDHVYEKSPIDPVFEGNFEGLGNAITNVKTRGPGFFNVIDARASVANLRLNITVEAPDAASLVVGGLASRSGGALYGDDVSGRVGFDADVVSDLGGLIGAGSGSIAHCSSSAALVSGTHGAEFGMGGLAGEFSGTITDSFATAEIKAGDVTAYAGGLVGLFHGDLRHSHATGDVTAAKGVVALGYGIGGLVGEAEGPVSDSYATGNVISSREGDAGGLVGIATAPISGSFSTGNVGWESGTLSIGGLVGLTSSRITDSYATGDIKGAQIFPTAGLLGTPSGGSNASVATSYASGRVGADHGGAGFSAYTCSCFVDNYWNVSISRTTNGVQGGNAAGVTGLTTRQLQSELPPGFNPTIWAHDPYINQGFPYLIANPPPQ